MKKNKIKSIAKVKSRIREKITGTSNRPRLSVFRSNSHIYAQIIDDVTGHTLAASSTVDPEIREKQKTIIRMEISSGYLCE